MTKRNNAWTSIIIVTIVVVASVPRGGWAQDEGGVEIVPENTSATCQDSEDNDGDSRVDCDDQDCWDFIFCESRSGQASATDEEEDAQASDGEADQGEGAEEGAQVVEEDENSRGVLISGVVLASLGTIAVAAGGLLALAWDDRPSTRAGSLALFAAGGTILLTGIIMSAVGGSSIRSTQETTENESRGTSPLALSPTLTPTTQGGLLFGLVGLFR